MNLLLALIIGSTPTAKTEVVVLAAASLRAPLSEIARNFERTHPSIRFQISFAGSQELATQINLGAKADVFFSADRAQIDVVVKSKKADDKQVWPFASNELALLVSKSATSRINRLVDLQKDGTRISMAGEKVPVGAYTQQMLGKASQELGSRWLKNVRLNTVSFESNVSAVFARVEMDEVDAGFVYRTDAQRAKKSAMLQIPKEWNVRARYYVAILKSSDNARTAQALVNLVLDKEGQAVLARYGFRPPK